MNEFLASTSPAAESSLLLLILAAVVAVLTLHVTLDLLHGARRRLDGPPGRRIGLLAQASSALGLGLTATTVLVLASEAFSFRLGFRASEVMVLMPASLVAGGVVCGVLLHLRRNLALALGGPLLGVMALGLQHGWMEAVGFRPGLTWDPMYLAAAAAVLVIGSTAGLLLADPVREAHHHRRSSWRPGAALLIGLAIVTGQEVLHSGVGLPSQVGSVYLKEVPGTLLTVIAGVFVPLLLAGMAIDRAVRNSQRRRARHTGLAPMTEHRRRTRRKIRTL
jgi:NO-binding membrane sensor protein with MHYT domain